MACQDLNGVVVFRPYGHLHEGSEIDRLESGLAYMLDGGVRHVVINLGRVGRLSARAVGVMASAHALAQRNGGHLTVTGAHRDHFEIFRITGLSEVLDLRGSLDALVERIERRSQAVA